VNRKQRRATEEQRLLTYELQNGKCAICNRELEESFHVDHIYPYSAGGETVLGNLQALCQTCNLRKGAKLDG
jgi:5-methylcytosine-specific restriction endonuclease McrA